GVEAERVDRVANVKAGKDVVSGKEMRSGGELGAQEARDPSLGDVNDGDRFRERRVRDDAKDRAAEPCGHGRLPAVFFGTPRLSLRLGSPPALLPALAEDRRALELSHGPPHREEVGCGAIDGET